MWALNAIAPKTMYASLEGKMGRAERFSVPEKTNRLYPLDSVKGMP